VRPQRASLKRGLLEQGGPESFGSEVIPAAGKSLLKPYVRPGRAAQHQNHDLVRKADCGLGAWTEKTEDRAAGSELCCFQGGGGELSASLWARAPWAISHPPKFAETGGGCAQGGGARRPGKDISAGGGTGHWIALEGRDSPMAHRKPRDAVATMEAGRQSEAAIPQVGLQEG